MGKHQIGGQATPLAVEEFGLFRALLEAQALIGSGERDTAKITETCCRILHDAGVRIDYFDLAGPATLTPVPIVSGPVRAMGAIWVGPTRLIDNILCVPDPRPSALIGG